MDYDLMLADKLLELCDISYLSESEIETILIEDGYTNFKYFENKNSQAFGITKDDKAYIVVRGTEFNSFNEIEDVISTFRLLKSDLNGKKVHYGYYNYFDNIRSQLEEYIKDHSDKDFIFTGYSMGGTTATFLSYLYPNSITYTFATPMSVTSDFDNENRKIYNFYSDKDLFAQMPYGFRGFKHFGKRYAIKKDGEIRQDGSTRNIVNRFKLTLLGLAIAPWIMLKIGFFIGRYFYRNHNTPVYKERLKNAINKYI